MPSSREIGDRFAKKMCLDLNQSLAEPMKLTKNSGATHRDADMKNSYMAVDCKGNAGGDFRKSLPYDELDKVTMQAGETARIGILIGRRLPQIPAI